MKKAATSILARIVHSPAAIASTLTRAIAVRLELSAATEVVAAFLCGEAFGQAAQGVPQRIHRADDCGPQQCRQLGKDCLDRVQARAVRRQERHTCAGRLDHLTYAGHVEVTRIVHDHRISRLQSGPQDLRGIGEEGIAVRRTIDHRRCHRPVTVQHASEDRGFSSQPTRPHVPLCRDLLVL